MPAYPDAVVMLRQLRPEDEPVPDPALLERILAAPAERPPRAARRLALAAVAVAVLVVALTPLGRSSPAVVALAAAALDDPDTILHYRAEVRRPGADPATFEVWQTAGARQRRLLHDGLEWAEDWDTRTSLAYSAETNELMRHTEPDIFDPDHRIPPGIDAPSPLAGGLNMADDLARLFERAGRGEGGVRLVGPARVRGIDVHELEVDFTAESLTGPVEILRTVYVDRETFLPVRVVERFESRTTAITDYVLAERLPRTPANERFLRMSPHPGARRVTEGRL